MANEKRQGCPPAKSAASKTADRKCRGNSVDDQRARLLEALEARPLTTIDIRRDLDIMMPAARVFELRHAGKNIVTTWADQPTDGSGRTHRVALYALLPASQMDLFGTDADNIH